MTENDYTKPRPYTGILAQRKKSLPTKEEEKKIVSALYDHFDLEERAAGAKERLLMAIVKNCIPAFQITGMPGRRRNAFDRKLFDDIEAVRRKEKVRTIKSACAILKKHPDYQGRSEGALNSAYHRLLKAAPELKMEQFIYKYLMS